MSLWIYQLKNIIILFKKMSDKSLTQHILGPDFFNKVETFVFSFSWNYPVAAFVFISIFHVFSPSHSEINCNLHNFCCSQISFLSL